MPAYPNKIESDWMREFDLNLRSIRNLGTQYLCSLPEHARRTLLSSFHWDSKNNRYSRNYRREKHDRGRKTEKNLRVRKAS